MDVFKTRPFIMESIPISEINFTNAVKKDPRYYGKSKDGERKFFAVCPICDNPIQLIGLYKETKYIKHGRHHKGDVKYLAAYDEDAYMSCPYHNANKEIDSIKRKNMDTVNAIYRLLKKQFDRIIYIWNITTGIRISYAFAEEVLRNYVNDEGYMYLGSTYYNLSYMIMYAQEAVPLLGRAIKKESEVYRALLELDEKVYFEDGENGYAWLRSKNKEFINLTWYIHKHTNKVVDEHLKESFELVIKEDNEIIFTQEIVVDHHLLKRLMDMPEEKQFRNKKLLDIAERILK